MSSIFNTILDKLGIHKKETPKESAATTTPAVPTTTYEPGFSGSYGAPAQGPHVSPPAPAGAPRPPAYTPGGTYPPAGTVPTTPPTQAAPAEMPMVDVVSHLDYLAKTGPIQGLNWRMSINDLMALLGLPHKAQDIKNLAIELGCPEKEMGDSYSRNVWTHQALLKKIAENGGNIPANLLK
jgi:hypothetical protein